MLCDQLEAPGAVERGVEFLREIRPGSHALDLPSTPVTRALDGRARALGGRVRATADRLAALGAGGPCWPARRPRGLDLVGDPRGAAAALHRRRDRAPAATGIAAHRRRFGRLGGRVLAARVRARAVAAPGARGDGVRATCVELTSLGRGDPRHLQPLQTDAGPVLWPIDRELIDSGLGRRRLPVAARVPRPPPPHRFATTAWRTDGAPTTRRGAGPGRARRARVRAAAAASGSPAAGSASCAFDTELFGHWWYEGVAWLGAVIAAAAQGLPLTTLDDALERHPRPRAGRCRPRRSWGEGGDLRTWSAPRWPTSWRAAPRGAAL